MLCYNMAVNLLAFILEFAGLIINNNNNNDSNVD